MKGIITKDGNLKIDRGHEPETRIKISCPFQNKDVPCGQWCPHFGEPKRIETTLLGALGPEVIINDGAGRTLEICHGKILEFETLTFEVGK